MRPLTAAQTLLGWSLLLVPLACSSASPADGVPVSAEANASAPVGRKPDARFHVDARQALGYLASDELEGRGIDTPGINKAADFIANAFDKFGLVPLGDKGTYFEAFKMTTATKPGAGTSLSAALADDGEPQKYDLKSGFVPVSFSGEGKFEGDAEFVGYGVSDAHAGYDDYAGLDVKGKVVIAMRFEPHTADGKSRISGTDDWSENATLARKMKVAADHGAAAIVMVNPVVHHQGDILLPFASMFVGDKAGIPMVQVTQGIANQWLKEGGADTDLKALQDAIDASGKPSKVTLSKSVRVSGTVQIERQQRDVKNVVALLPGTDRSDAREYVVVGAHYDHLGRGGSGSLAPGKNEIHNGADDNASGTTAMLELAEHYAKDSQRSKRSMIFIAFTAEESGLVGSSRFVDHPPVALDKVVAMLNLDMVGRVKDQTLFIGGQGTAPSFEQFLKDADDASPLQLKNIGKGGFGPSDHMSFAMKKVPVLFFFSGVHADYHRPTDDADKINYEGMDEVVKLGVSVTDHLLTMPKEQYVDAADSGGMQMMGSGSGSAGNNATLGVVPDYASEDVKGVKISGTVPNSPAAAAGLKGGDVITGWNGDPITNLYELSDVLRKGKPGDKVKVTVLRDGKPVEVEATLAARKG